MIELTIEACGKRSKLRLLTPKAFTCEVERRRATWQIDYVKHIVLTFIAKVKELCFEDQDPTIELEFGDAVRLVEKVKEKLRETYTTRRGVNIVASIRESHVKKALKELRREIEKEGFEGVCRKYLVKFNQI